eukprot:gene23179-31499_t
MDDLSGPSGILFTGTQGISKTVVYEVSEQKSVNIIRSDERMRIQQCPAAVSSANSEEPAQSRAFLIVTSSRNTDNSRQTERRHIHRCVIPSYTVDELKNYIDYFGIGLEELTTRCYQIGLSFRYVLTGNYELTNENTEAKAQRVTAEQMDGFIENNGLSGDSREVDSIGATRLKGVYGNYFELVLDDHLKNGNFKHCRTLSEPGAVEVGQDCVLQLFQKRDHVSQRSFVDVPAALLACGTSDKDNDLFSYCKSFPVIGFATADFSVCFQATTSDIQLVFVVPEKDVFSKWRFIQSFTYTEEIVEKGLDGREAVVKRQKQSKFAQLPTEMQVRVEVEVTFSNARLHEDFVPVVRSTSL